MSTNSTLRKDPLSPVLRSLPVLVVGATGGVGEGIVRALLDEGRHVVAAGRSAERLATFVTSITRNDAEAAARLSTFALDVSDRSHDPGAALRSQFGPLGGAVITIGSFAGAQRPLLEVDDAVWDDAIADNLTSQFWAIRAVLPALHPQGALVHISGQSADFPYPGSALIGLTNAARKSLVLSLAAELGGAGPRIYELIIGVTRTRPRQAAGFDDPRWISAEEVGVRAGRLLDGVDPRAGEALHYAVEPEPQAARTEQPESFRISPGADVGHVALRVTDVPRALAFWRDGLGLTVEHEMGDQAAFLAAGGYHHHVALLAAPEPGMEHVAIRLPDREALDAAVQHVATAGARLRGPFDHGTTLSYYTADPDGNGVELYIDAPGQGDGRTSRGGS